MGRSLLWITLGERSLLLQKSQTMIAGIVADKYKVDTFKERLTKTGFTFNVLPFKFDTMIFHVNYTEKEDLKKIAMLCKEIETLYKSKN